uniref:Uncharacterized protein n=1 Tax=Acrobeloides nanus TaxID=290746 RepID=A0A914D1H8_9BILA
MCIAANAIEYNKLKNNSTLINDYVSLKCNPPNNSAGLTISGFSYGTSLDHTAFPIAKCSQSNGIRYYWNAVTSKEVSSVHDDSIYNENKDK